MFLGVLLVIESESDVPVDSGRRLCINLGTVTTTSYPLTTGSINLSGSFSFTTTIVGDDAKWLREGWKEEGEGGRTVLAQGMRFPGPFTLIYSANHQEATLGAFWVSEHGYDVAEDSRHRLHLDLNTDTTLSSYPRFQTPYTAPEYAGLSVQAYFGLLNPFPASADSADTVVWSFDGLSPPSPPPSVNTYNDEFIVAVVPEATEPSLDDNFAAVGISCKVERIRGRWRHRAVTPTLPSCSETSRTPGLPFWGLSAPALSSSLRLEEWNYKKGGRSWKKDGERQRDRIRSYLAISPTSTTPTQSVVVAGTLGKPVTSHSHPSTKVYVPGLNERLRIHSDKSPGCFSGRRTHLRRRRRLARSFFLRTRHLHDHLLLPPASGCNQQPRNHKETSPGVSWVPEHNYEVSEAGADVVLSLWHLPPHSPPHPSSYAFPITRQSSCSLCEQR
ncbi:hypothetical protein Moror_15539 [Moniliophthora roreri MCA 2997]|uniref:Uncharacterized protein n=1 Tax=Moniliophthora roreri (strain MCA 2997) TaxID=1381753 RepID=V2XMF7_MONRO|nr:hypothetical protein Moror_15539 [Moniliophthora roreri MCA 2997]